MVHSRLPSVDGSRDIEKNVVPSSDDDPEKGSTPESGSRPQNEQQDEHLSVSDSDDEGVSRRSTGARSIASRVVSRITTRSSIMPPPPPDGGFAAWMVGEYIELDDAYLEPGLMRTVVAGHLVIMCTW